MIINFFLDLGRLVTENMNSRHESVMRRIRPQVEDDWIPPSLDNRLSRKKFFLFSHYL